MRKPPEGFIIPNFGGTPSAEVPGPSDTPVASSGGGYTGRRKLALICSKGNLDMAYPGLILGNAAASEGVEVHMFFTFWGLDIINKKTNRNLQFTMIGNTAMHMSELGRLRPGLEHWSMPQFVGRLPGMTKASTMMMHKQLEELEIPSVPDFLDLIAAAGVNMYACRMTFDMMKLIEADMHPAVQGVISANDFIEISEGAQIIFI